MDISSPKQKLSLFFVLVVLIISGAVAGWMLNVKLGGKCDVEKTVTSSPAGPVNYVIPGVPYYGIHNHTEKVASVYGDVSLPIASVMQYWNPDQANLQEMSRYFTSQRGFISDEVIKKYMDFAANDQYVVQNARIEIQDLKKYINPEIRTPLLFGMPVAADQPEKTYYHPLNVLIGINEPEKKVIFHSIWFGNNYELSFDDFQKYMERMRSDERHQYLIIQAKDLKNKLTEIDGRGTQPYPARGQVVKMIEPMVRSYTLGYGTYRSGVFDQAISFFNKIIEAPNFESSLPPYFKMKTYVYLSMAHLKMGNVDKAVEYANNAVEVNHDLDKPFLDWPGYSFSDNSIPGREGESSEPYKIAGDAHLKKANYDKAMENFQKAIDIRTEYPEAEMGINQVLLMTMGSQSAVDTEDAKEDANVE